MKLALMHQILLKRKSCSSGESCSIADNFDTLMGPLFTKSATFLMLCSICMRVNRTLLAMDWKWEDCKMAGLLEDIAMSPSKNLLPGLILIKKSVQMLEKMITKCHHIKENKNSINYADIIANRHSFISLDVETGGPNCGILQHYATLADHSGTLLGHDDFYIKPPCNVVFLSQAVKIHWIVKGDARLVDASSIGQA